MITLSVYDRDLYQTETPYSLDGFQGKGQIKKSVDDEVIADIDVTINGNTITLFIPHERTSLIPTTGDQFYKVEKYFYDVIISNPPIRAGKNIVYEIVMNARNYLKEDGKLFIVINKDQGAKSLYKDLEKVYNILK